MCNRLAFEMDRKNSIRHSSMLTWFVITYILFQFQLAVFCFRTKPRLIISNNRLPRASSTSKLFAKKQRVDQILISRNLAADVAEAKVLVMAGCVILENGEVVASPALKVDETRALRIRQRKSEPYVSRAGRKLAGAVEMFDLSHHIIGSTCIDIGCSTGGFTDVLLHNNCSKVYAVDVGVSLLDWKIRSDPRVVVLEKQNARYVNATVIPEPGRIDMVVCDVSFISLRQVLPPSLALCRAGAILCALIKPQFECKKEEIGSGGIVRDDAVRQRVVNSTLDWFHESHADWSVRGVMESPITGHDGNVEYLLVAQKLST